MKIKFITIGKTEESWLLDGINKYEAKIPHYVRFESVVIPAIKNMAAGNVEQQKQKEGELLLKYVAEGDMLIVLDERGKHYSSVEFSAFLQQYMNAGAKQLVFAVGGPFGFSDDVYKRANAKVSLSKMTFSHQMVRLFFVEQLYRAMTILKGEKYHHE